MDTNLELTCVLAQLTARRAEWLQVQASLDLFCQTPDLFREELDELDEQIGTTKILLGIEKLDDKEVEKFLNEQRRSLLEELKQRVEGFQSKLVQLGVSSLRDSRLDPYTCKVLHEELVAMQELLTSFSLLMGIGENVFEDDEGYAIVFIELGFE